MPSRHVYIPTQFGVEATVGRNPIIQIQYAEHQGPADVEPYSAGRVNGELVTIGERKILVVPRSVVTPPGDVDSVLYLPGSGAATDRSDYRSRGGRPKWIFPRPAGLAGVGEDVWAARVESVRDSWSGQFSFVEERTEQQVVEGLRAPQVGALYSALAHWKVTDAPATIVMPTGTGKTETMLALFAKERAPRLVVVVPSVALRDQISLKFLTWGMLKRLGVVGPDAQFPLVGVVQHRFTTAEQVKEFFARCNVIITTVNAVAGSVTTEVSEEVQRAMAEHASHLFVDEAHHIPAATWERFRRFFLEAGRPVLQFTATPFRNDRKPVEGKIIFNYPLRKAQEENYFKPIIFSPVLEFDTERADEVIARAAVDQLNHDLSHNLNHLVMARTGTIERAETVLEVYKNIAPQHSPMLVHSQQGVRERRETLENLRTSACRIVVCVDMLGEGFDLPELKIAAMHDIHKSMAITLQFTGRFTRFRSDLGDATVIANVADPKVEIALRELYAEDADWNVLLRDLSKRAIALQERRLDFLNDFNGSPARIPLQNVYPKMSTVVFKTKCNEWHPENLHNVVRDDRLYSDVAINENAKVLLFVTRELFPVQWGMVREIRDIQHDLYIVHWNKQQGLLFINSSNNDDVHERLAEEIAGPDTRLLRGEQVFRSLHGIHQLLLMNLGLSHSYSGAVRFSMHMGSDVRQGLADAQILGKIKANLFGRGYEGGERASIGASKRGRIWSHLVAEDISAWVRWCEKIGGKLLDDTIDIRTILDEAMIPEQLVDRPHAVPISIEWPDEFYQRSEDGIFLDIAGKRVPFYEADVVLLDHQDSGPIKFQVTTDDRSVEYEMRFIAADPQSPARVEYVPTGNTTVEVTAGRRSNGLGQWFKEEPPVVRFGDGSFMVGNVLFKYPRQLRAALAPGRLEAWNWSSVDIEKESQLPKGATTKRIDSVQYHLIQELVQGRGPVHYDVIFDDDSAGEVADIVAIAATNERLIVHLFHCKFSGAPTAGARVEDFYAVCGQAQRSVQWRGNLEKMFTRLQKRDARRNSQPQKPSRFEKGDLTALRTLARQATMLVPEVKIYIVQPGLSKAAVTSDILELLGATEVYLKETFALPLGVIVSP
jgi:superfamily II DNA or RNA helicase